MNCTGRLHTAGGVGYKHAGVLLSLLPCSTAAPGVLSFTAWCLPAGIPGALQHARVGSRDHVQPVFPKAPDQPGNAMVPRFCTAEGGDETWDRAQMCFEAFR